MLWPKKNSHKDFDNEKKFPSPPITFLMVRPLYARIARDRRHISGRH